MKELGSFITMPSRKVTKRGKLNQIPTQFGQLDTTPTSRQFQSPAKPFYGQHSDREDKLPTPLQSSEINPQKPGNVPASSKEFEDEIDDLDLVQFSISHDNPTSLEQRVEGGAWSETASQTRRSSPLLAGDTPHHIWQFDEDESLSSFSDSKSSRLPDTMPLPPDPTLESQIELPFEAQSRVDFSETATTNQRSSPFSCRETPKQSLWDFKDESAVDFMKSAQLNIELEPKQGGLSHLPMEEMYDATPLKASRNDEDLGETQPHQLEMANDPFEQATNEDEVGLPVKGSKRRTMGEMLQSELASENGDNPDVEYGNFDRHLENDSSQQSIQTPKLNSKASTAPGAPKEPMNDLNGKKRKQRPKVPLQFDETTHQIKDAPREKKPSPPARMPIVNALRESAQPSSSPNTSSRKRAAPKRAQPKKKRKVMPLKERREEPSRPVTRSVAAEDPDPKTTAKSDLPKMRPNVDTQKATKPKEIKLSHGSTKAKNQLIMVSSDTDGSEFQPDPSLSSPEQPETADTTVEHQTRESNKATSRTLRPEFGPGDGFHNPEASSHSDTLNEEQTQLDVKPNRRQVQNRRKPQQGNRTSGKNENDAAHEVRYLENQAVLVDHSSNIQMKPAPGNREEKHDESSYEACQKRIVQTQQVLRGSKAARTISIGVAGSPLLLNDDSTSLAVQSKDHGSGSSAQEDESISRKLDFGLLNSHKARPPNMVEESEAPLRGRNSLAMDFANIESSKVGKPFSAYAKESQRRLPPAQSLPPQFANMNKDVHGQILAALQSQDAEFQQSDTTQTEDSISRNREDVITNENYRERGNEATEQLHEIVDVRYLYLSGDSILVSDNLADSDYTPQVQRGDNPQCSRCLSKERLKLR